MTRKTIYICDLCSEQFPDASKLLTVQTQDSGYDVCHSCVQNIVKLALKHKGWPNNPLRPFCEVCHGTGKAKIDIESDDYFRGSREVEVPCVRCDLKKKEK